MPDALQTDGGTAATHEELTVLPLRVAPATAGEKNRVTTGIIPIACWRVEDLRFEFGLSFVRPEIGEEIRHLKSLREAHKVTVAAPTAEGAGVTLYPPLTIFGHADPVGGDDFNKVLSGRRAMAIYALLTRKTVLWENLHSKPLGNDDWGDTAVATMLARLGFLQADDDGQGGNAHAAALQSYQQARGLAVSGRADAATRTKLYREYMDSLCGADFVLDPIDHFVGRGKDPQGKSDYQGCGDFNLVRIFSRQEEQDFSRDENHPQRNLANAPNRRVMVLLFQPGTYVDPQKWPCPRAGEGVSGCLKRFWSDADKRQSHQSERRDYADSQDTFACRFYDRMTSDSPCERRNSVTDKPFQLQIRDHQGNPVANCPYSLSLQGRQTNDSTDGSGFIRLQTCADGTGKLQIKDQTYELNFDDSLPEDVKHTQALLNALGFNAGPLDGILGRRTEDALKSYQRTRKLSPTGKIDDPTSKSLRKDQVIRDFDQDKQTAPPAAGEAQAPKSTNGHKPKARVKPAPKGLAPPTAAPSTTTGDPTPPAPPPPPPPPPPTPTVIKTESTSRVDLPPPHDQLSAAIVRRFSDMDLDKDGFLSKKEIDTALGKSDFSGVDGAMVAVLKKLFGDFEEFSNDEWGPENDGITLADVTAYDRLREKKPSNETIRQIGGHFAYAKDKINTTAKTLFVGDPDVLSVRQGLIGDCWFLSALVGVGMRDKADVVKMVKPKAGSTDEFEVNFPGVSGAITVTKPTDGELAIFSTVPGNGLWLPILEKAYGTAVNQSKYFFVDASVTNTIDAGNTLGKGIKVMTGHDSTSNTISFTRGSKLRKQLSDAFTNKKISTAGIITIPFKEFRKDGLPMGHAYTVLSYDSGKDVIRLRNPWGNTGPTGVVEDRGAFDMKMSTFFNDFSDLASED